MFKFVRMLAFVSVLFLGACDWTESRPYEARLPPQYNKRCDPRASPPQIWTEGQEAMLCGVLGRTAGAYFEALRPGTISFITVRSTGGDGVIINEIIKNVNDLEITAAFDGICISACLGLYIGSNEVEVGDDAIFIAHSTLGYRLELIQRSGHWSTSELERVADIRADFDSSFRAAGVVPWDFHLESTALVEPLCAGGFENGAVSLATDGRTAFNSRFQYWIPLAATLLRWRGPSRRDSNLTIYDATLPERMVAQWPYVGRMALREPLPDDAVVQLGETLAGAGAIPICNN